MCPSTIGVIALLLAYSGAQLTVFLPQMRIVWQRAGEEPDSKLNRLGVALLVIALALALFAAVE